MTIENTNQVQIVIVKKDLTKADLARAVFNDCYKDLNQVPQRKDIINRLVSECGLTVNGAATYLQNMKTKAGLVVKKK